MIQQPICIPVRILCAYFIFTTFLSLSSLSSVRAQVPTQELKAYDNPNAEHTTVIKTVAAGNAIHLGLAPKANWMTVLNMKGSDQEFVRSFTFKNTSTIPYTITSVDFLQKDHTFEIFSIEPGKTLPMEVAQGQTFTLHVAFHGFERNDLRSNELRILTNQHKEPIYFYVQGMQLPLSDMPWNNRGETSNRVADSQVN